MSQRDKARKAMPGFFGPGRPKKFAGGGLAKALLGAAGGGGAAKMLGGAVGAASGADAIGGIAGMMAGSRRPLTGIEMVYGALKKKPKPMDEKTSAMSGAPKMMKTGGYAKKGKC